MAKASLLRKEKKQTNKQTKKKKKKTPKGRGGLSQERHWSGNDEILGFLRQGF